jgi:predicted CXXCH cytochrome family protein
MKMFLTRLFYGFLFALPLMLVTYAMVSVGHAQAQTALPQITPASIASCPACHKSYQLAWQTSAHNRSTTDPVFTSTWEAQGKPNQCMTCHTTGYNPDTNTSLGDGITCQACHDTAAANHPMQPMTADRSSKMCGTCHTETYFEWQASAHRQAGVDCIACHDPHTTTLKAKDTSALCATCHQDTSAHFQASQHSQQGLNCADCHLAKLPDPTQGHARRDHTFQVRLTTCNTCHSYQMHDPSQVHTVNPTPQPPDALAAVQKVNVADQPQPVQPFGFAMLSGVFGLGAGAILAPWLVKVSHKRKKKDEEEE